MENSKKLELLADEIGKKILWEGRPYKESIHNLGNVKSVEVTNTSVIFWSSLGEIISDHLSETPDLDPVYPRQFNVPSDCYISGFFLYLELGVLVLGFLFTKQSYSHVVLLANKKEQIEKLEELETSNKLQSIPYELIGAFQLANQLHQPHWSSSPTIEIR